LERKKKTMPTLLETRKKPLATASLVLAKPRPHQRRERRSVTGGGEA
jgi:hypothetical protein